jgi:hypothetical protein
MFHGFFGYFELKLSPSTCLSNYPKEGNSLESWGPFYFPIDVSSSTESFPFEIYYFR